MADWLPGTREGQLNMAKVWSGVVQNRGSGWGIPPNIMAEPGTASANILQIL